jgi:hypothetical protein
MPAFCQLTAGFLTYHFCHFFLAFFTCTSEKKLIVRLLMTRGLLLKGFVLDKPSFKNKIIHISISKSLSNAAYFKNTGDCYTSSFTISWCDFCKSDTLLSWEQFYQCLKNK